MPGRNREAQIVRKVQARIRNKKMGIFKEATVFRLPQHLQNFTLKIRRICEEVVNTNLDRKPSATGEAKLH
jgi:hypothetical protein